MLVNDDHVPEPPPETWTANATYTYTRVVFPPKQFPGPLALELGLFDPKSRQRLALRGEDTGQLAYRAAVTTLLPHARAGETRFGSGFFPPYSEAAAPFVSVRWIGRKAQVSLPNPTADALLLLRAATDPRAFAAVPLLTLELESQPVGRPYEIRSDEPFTLAVRVDAAALGRQERCELGLRMSSDFISRYEARPLALRVYDVALLPIRELPPELVALAQP